MSRRYGSTARLGNGLSSPPSRRSVAAPLPPSLEAPCGNVPELAPGPSHILVEAGTKDPGEQLIESLAVPPSVHVGLPGHEGAAREHAAVESIVVDLRVPGSVSPSVECPGARVRREGPKRNAAPDSILTLRGRIGIVRGTKRGLKDRVLRSSRPWKGQELSESEAGLGSSGAPLPRSAGSITSSVTSSRSRS